MSDDGLPDFTGWPNEEVGAFIKGIEYIKNGGDVAEIMDNDIAKSLLSKLDTPTADSIGPDGAVGTVAPGLPSRSQYIERVSQLADRKFRESFKGHSFAVAAQLSADIRPFIDEITDGLKTSEITYATVDDLLKRMVIVASASTLMAIQTVGFK